MKAGLLRYTLPASALLFVAAASSLHAQVKIRNLELFRDNAYSLHEDMDQILKLTPEQSAKLNEAIEKKINDPEVASARDAFKGSGSDEDKKAFYKAQEIANATYRNTVEAILTPEQKDLIDRVSDYAKTVWNELDEIKHWGERMRKMKEIGPERLREILTPEQLAILGIETPTPGPAPAAEQPPATDAPENP